MMMMKVDFIDNQRQKDKCDNGDDDDDDDDFIDNEQQKITQNLH